jgi:hypothetical protein
MAITPVNASLTNTTAGTRTQVVSDTDIKPTSVYFEALASNTGFIYVGLSTVSSTVYIVRLSAGQGFSLQADGIGGRGRLGGIGIQLSNLYIDSSVSGEKVLVTYQYPIGG